MTELKPCPYCGGSVKITRYIPSGRFGIFCTKCTNVTYFCKTEREAVDLWNNEGSVVFIPCSDLLKWAAMLNRYSGDLAGHSGYGLALGQLAKDMLAYADEREKTATAAELPPCSAMIRRRSA